MYLQQQCDRSRSLAVGAMTPIEKFYREEYFVGAQRRALDPAARYGLKRSSTLQETERKRRLAKHGGVRLEQLAPESARLACTSK